MAVGKYQKWLEPDNLILLEAWARNGLTDKQIAHNIGISEQTLNVWKNKYSSFLESLKKGKEVIDIQVENALLKRALGYEYEEVKTKREMGITTEIVTTKKFIPPDTTAQIFWLKNRKSEQWRDRREVDNKVDFETDGFIEALKEQVGKTFQNASDVIEEDAADESKEESTI